MKDKTKERIIELVPEVIEKYDRCMGCGYGFDHCKMGKNCPLGEKELPIALAVVLRAIGTRKEGARLTVDEFGFFLLNGDQQYVRIKDAPQFSKSAKWNLSQDNYDQQSEECKRFIGSLLGV